MSSWRDWLSEQLTALLETRGDVITEVQQDMRHVLTVQSLSWKDEGLPGLFAVVHHVIFDGEFIHDVLEQSVFLGSDFRETGPLSHPELLEDAFDAFCSACAFNLERGLRMPADIITLEELGFTLTRLIETWVRQGKPEPEPALATRPPTTVTALTDEELAGAGDAFTHGFRIEGHTVLLSTYLHEVGLWLVDGQGTMCRLVEPDGNLDSVGFFATRENPAKVQAFVRWLIDCLRASGLEDTPIIEDEYDDEPSDATLSQWLLLNHGRWIDVDPRIQPGYVRAYRGYDPHPLFEAFVRDHVLT
jgi:hypothetical protein